MGIAEAVKKIGLKVGLDEDEMTDLLADGETPSADFSDEIPGQAADVLEIFLSDKTTEPLEDANGHLWYPMIRAGQHAMRPGANGQKVRKPLKVIAGKSQDPLKEIGLQDLVDAFKADAVDYVTVPTSHDNKTLENTGFIRDMKIADAEVQTGPLKGRKLPHLFGAYDFTEPDVKAKVKRGTIPGRSCGILYNYENTETGENFASVIEHVALTPKPWIRGMLAFGRKLSEDKEPVQMVLSDEEPEEADHIDVQLAEGDATVTWTHEDSPNWLRQQVDELLRVARTEKRKNRPQNSYVEDPSPYYRCNEAKSESPTGGRALISDGYGEGANYWVAPFSVDDGNVELSDFSTWDSVKSVYVSDDRPAPPAGKEPLSDEPPKKLTARDRLELAQAARKHKTGSADVELSTTPKTTHPRGGDQMPDEEKNGKLVLSEEAKSQIAAAEARAQAAEEKAEKLSEKVGKLSEAGQVAHVSGFIEKLKGMDFDEEHGFTGALSVLENILLADDGEPAIVSEKLSEDGNTEVEMTITQAFEAFFEAIKTKEDGKIALGEQLEQPSSEETKDDTAGKQSPEPGKPPATDLSDEDDFSLEGAADRAQELAEANPYLANLTGMKPAEKKEEVNA